jgi:hypothetical protein
MPPPRAYFSYRLAYAGGLAAWLPPIHQSHTSVASPTCTLTNILQPHPWWVPWWPLPESQPLLGFPTRFSIDCPSLLCTLVDRGHFASFTNTRPYISTVFPSEPIAAAPARWTEHRLTLPKVQWSLPMQYLRQGRQVIAAVHRSCLP